MVEDFDAFFNSAEIAPDSDGRYLCQCNVCKSFGVPCHNSIQVPGDTCDSCIAGCYAGRRDITR